MIYSLRGALIAVEQNFVVVECAGVGYGVRTTAGTLGRLPKMGQEVKLYTCLNIREDAAELFGFIDRQELEGFRMLTAVSGVGPKAALAILSELGGERLMLAVAGGDAKAITRAPGVGPKLANRIVLELKDKVPTDFFSAGGEGGAAAALPPQEDSAAGEAVSALVALGYSQQEAASAIGRLPPGQPVQELIKGALKVLSARR